MEEKLAGCRNRTVVLMSNSSNAIRADATQLASKVSQQTTQATGGDAAEHAKDHYAEDEVS